MIDELIEYPQTPDRNGRDFRGAGTWAGSKALPGRGLAGSCLPAFDLPSHPTLCCMSAPADRLKLWSAEKWLQLARWLDERSLEVVWSGGRGEEAIVEQIDPEKRYPSYAGQLELAQMWRLIAHAVVFISPDTGVAHLARLTGVPAVSLFGPGSSQLFGRGDFWRDMPCAEVTIENFPCRDQQDVFGRERAWVRRCGRSPRQCKADARCMKDIGVAAVIRAVDQMLAPRDLSFDSPPASFVRMRRQESIMRPCSVRFDPVSPRPRPHRSSGTARHLVHAESHYRHLARGFNWLGGATVVSKAIDFSTILVVVVLSES